MPLVGHSAVDSTRRGSNLERERRRGRRARHPSGAAKPASTTVKTGTGSGDTPSGTATVSRARGASVRSSYSPLSVWLSPDVGNVESRAGNGSDNNTRSTAGACSPPGKSTARPPSPRHEHTAFEGTKNATPTSSPRGVNVPEAAVPCEEPPSHREEDRYRGERETRGPCTSTAETFRERLDRRLDRISLPVRGPGLKRLTSTGRGTKAASRSAQGGVEEPTTVAAAKATREDVTAATTAAETARGRTRESSTFLGHSCNGEARTVVGVFPPAGDITATEKLWDGEGLAIEEDEKSRIWEWEKVKVDWSKKPSH